MWYKDSKARLPTMSGVVLFACWGYPQSPRNRPLRWSGCAAFCRFKAFVWQRKYNSYTWNLWKLLFCHLSLEWIFPFSRHWSSCKIAKPLNYAKQRNRKTLCLRVWKWLPRRLPPGRTFPLLSMPLNTYSVQLHTKSTARPGRKEVNWAAQPSNTLFPTALWYSLPGTVRGENAYGKLQSLCEWKQYIRHSCLA